MTITIWHAVFNLIVFIGWYCLFKKQEYSLIRVFENIIVGSKCPYLLKDGNARGVNYPTFGGDRGVAFMNSNPLDRIILVINAGSLLFTLFRSS